MAIDGDLWLQYASASNFTSLEAGELTLYPESHEVFIAQENVRCSRTQFRLLAKLLSEFCKTVSYEQMMETQVARSARASITCSRSRYVTCAGCYASTAPAWRSATCTGRGTRPGLVDRRFSLNCE